MTNHRLRGALLNAELSGTELAQVVGVDPKSVSRWISEDRVPYPLTRIKVARALNQQETFLWPTLLEAPYACDVAAAELDRIWPTRRAVSTETWHALFSRTTSQLDILVYAGGFLIETLDLADVLRWKASKGTSIRILVGDAESAAVQMRADEISLSWLPDRCRTTVRYLRQVDVDLGLHVRIHGTTLYASQFRFDDHALLNTHAFGAWACDSPVIELQRCNDGRLFDFYAGAFERGL